MTTLSLHRSPRPRHPIALALGRVLLRSIPYSVIATLEGLVQLTGPPRVRYLVFINALIVVMVGLISLVSWLATRRRRSRLDAQVAALKRAIRDPDPSEIDQLFAKSRRRRQEDHDRAYR